MAVAGVTSGLINLNESVTFRGKHFGLYQTHTSKITAMEIPHYFVDEMTKGRFESFRHEHTFVEKNGKTAMIDTIEYRTPFGILGKLFDKVILKSYLTKMITERNQFLKDLAEEHQQDQPKDRNALNPELGVIKTSIEG